MTQPWNAKVRNPTLPFSAKDIQKALKNKGPAKVS
jgi:hypothetical protein